MQFQKVHVSIVRSIRHVSLVRDWHRARGTRDLPEFSDVEFRCYSQNSEDGILLYTHDARAVLVSDSVERFLGVSRAEILGAKLHEVFSRNTRLGRLVRESFDARMALVQEEITTETGRQLYAQRKVTIEPVYGQIKYNRGITHFMRRGRAAVQSEWRLVAATHNLLKLHTHWTASTA